MSDADQIVTHVSRPSAEPGWRSAGALATADGTTLIAFTLLLLLIGLCLVWGSHVRVQ